MCHNSHDTKDLKKKTVKPKHYIFECLCACHKLKQAAVHTGPAMRGAGPESEALPKVLVSSVEEV